MHGQTDIKFSEVYQLDEKQIENTRTPLEYSLPIPFPQHSIKGKVSLSVFRGYWRKKFWNLISFMFRLGVENPTFSCEGDYPTVFLRDHTLQRDKNTLAEKAFYQMKIRGYFTDMRHSNSLMGSRFMFL
jgi:hypothetical protein